MANTVRKRRVVLALDPEVADLLEQFADGPRKKSELITRLLHREEAAQTSAAEPLFAIEDRLTAVERKLDLLLARLG